MIYRWRCRNAKRYKATKRPQCGCVLCWFKFHFRRGKRAKSGGYPPIVDTGEPVEIYNEPRNE